MGARVDRRPAGHVVPAGALPMTPGQRPQLELGGVDVGPEQQERHRADPDGVEASLQRLGTARSRSSNGSPGPVLVYHVKSQRQMASGSWSGRVVRVTIFS